VVERNVCNTLLNLSGYWAISACPASFICTSQAPGIFAAIIKELAGWIAPSSVPVMINVGLDIFESLSHATYSFYSLVIFLTLSLSLELWLRSGVSGKMKILCGVITLFLLITPTVASKFKNISCFSYYDNITKRVAKVADGKDPVIKMCYKKRKR
jgi:hypothetical protein